MKRRNFRQRTLSTLYRRLALGPGVLLALLAGCVTPTDRPLLWEIDGGRPSYLYGTIHVPDPRVLALPVAVKEALAHSDVFLGEIPLDQTRDQWVDDQSKLPEGQKLNDLLPPELYARTDRYFQAKGIALNTFADRKVWFVAATASVLDDLGQYLLRPPPDKLLYDLAKSRGKEVGGLETVAEQIATFESLTPEEQIQQLESTLTVCERARAEGTTYAKQLVVVYLRGDETELWRELQAGDDPDNAAAQGVLAKLVTVRNQRMAERIAKLLRDQPGTSFFFAVGAGHLVGEDAIVARLEQAGFSVKRSSISPGSGPGSDRR